MQPFFTYAQIMLPSFSFLYFCAHNINITPLNIILLLFTK